MGHTNATPNESLPQFVEDDKPSWLGDFNDAMRRIDAKFGTIDGTLANLQTQINNKADKTP